MLPSPMPWLRRPRRRFQPRDSVWVLLDSAGRPFFRASTATCPSTAPAASTRSPPASTARQDAGGRTPAEALAELISTPTSPAWWCNNQPSPPSHKVTHSRYQPSVGMIM